MHLSLLRSSGKIGFMTWEIIDKFILVANTLTEVDIESLQIAASVITKKLMQELKEMDSMFFLFFDKDEEE